MRKRKTTPQAKTGKIAEWRCGAPRGNRNAATTIGTLSARVRDLKKRARLAIAFAQAAARANESSMPEQQ
jgi:folate-dependent tRNA-U54 methylase TrmFO/GidA